MADTWFKYDGFRCLNSTWWLDKQYWCPPAPRCTLTSLAKYNLSVNIISCVFGVVDFFLLGYLAYTTAKALAILITIPKKSTPARI